MSVNPCLLKFDLARRGVRLGAGVGDHPDLQRPAAWPAGGVSDVELLLPEDVWASAPILRSVAATSPYELHAAGDGFVLDSGEEQCEVRIIPPPRFYEQTTRSGEAMGQVGRTHGNHIAINPAAGPGGLPHGIACRFCDIGLPRPARDAPLAVADVVDTVRAAFAEGAVEFVFFHLGTCDGEDGGVEFIEPYVRAIKRHFDTLVAVQLPPPQRNEWIDHTYAMGVDALGYSVELHDPALRRSRAAGRAAPADRDRCYAALAHAAAVFPNGTVWSDLIVGVESQESTMAGIDALVAAGVLPVLSLAQPPTSGAENCSSPPSAEELAPVFAHLFRAVRKARIGMHWVRDASYAITPFEARFSVDEEERAGAGLGAFYRSRLGGIAARNLSRLRRRLRVREVSDSFDSSQL